MKLKSLIILVIVISCLFSQSMNTFGESLSGKPTWEFYFPNIRALGTDITVGYHGFSLLKSAETNVFFTFGGANEGVNFYRNPDGTNYTVPTDGSDNLARYIRNELLWSVGIKQGLIYSENLQKNTLELFTFYKGRLGGNSKSDSPEGSLIFESGLPDKDGIFQNTLIAGLSFNGVYRNPWYLTRRGFYAEASMEIAPQAMNKVADFSRINVNLDGFLPLLESPKTSIYIADRVIWDSLSGNYIPINARTTFGGLRVLPGYLEHPGIPSEAGLGGAQRGIDYFRFDSNQKFVNNLDIRINFPTVIGYSLIPGLILYFDSGAYDTNMDGQIDFDNMYYSTGLGLHWSIFRQDVAVYCNYSINEKKVSPGFTIGILQF